MATMIAANSITATMLRSDSVIAAKIKAGVITATHMSANSITATLIRANAVNATHINVSNLSAINANMGNLTSGNIIIGNTNKLWLNASNDGALNIGGSTKSSAPFSINASGELTATGATVTGDFTVLGDENRTVLTLGSVGTENGLFIYETGLMLDSELDLDSESSIDLLS